MKKIATIILAAAVLFSCQKENPQDSPDGKASAVRLTINVNRALTKAVEGGHDGVNDAKISPKVLSVTVLSYNNAGTQLGATDLTSDQIKKAVWGSYREYQVDQWKPVTQPTQPDGAAVGLPKGTTRVDVVLNRAPMAEYTPETNVNHFNYRDNKNGQNQSYSYGEDNFDRVILTTDYYGVGAELTGAVAGAATPTYKMNFSVKPYLTRMEVHGGIDVAPEAVWTDGYKNQWRTMTVAAYEALDGGNVADATGNYPKGAVKGTAANGFDVNTVYIPEYYWYRTSGSTADPVARDAGNAFNTEAEIDDPGTDNAGWVAQPYYAGAGASAQVKWLPNRYYAVDVESVFINNIKVRGPERTPYLHPWPGSEVATGWLDWYKAFHFGGWHPTGTSAGNTFLCLGNMWDRIAEANSDADYQEITVPELNGISTMKIIKGKAKPVSGKSEYYDNPGSRNLGLAAGKAAAYVIYPQAKQTSTGAADVATLRNELPHIILKVKAYENAADYAAGTYQTGKEFITLSLFSDAAQGAGNYITSFQGGNIYRFDLNELLYSFVGDVPVPGGKPTDGKDPKDPVDPDPEMPASQLTMTVKVLEWTIRNIFPVI